MKCQYLIYLIPVLFLISIVVAALWDYDADGSAPALVGYWKLDGNAKDSSGNSNDGTVTGATITNKGRFKGAYEFDGKDDYIEIAGVDTFDISNNTPYSFSLWVNSVSTTETGYLFAKKQVAAGYGLYLSGGSLRWYDDKVISFNRNIGAGWQHITITYNGSGTVKLYQEGINTATVTGRTFIPDNYLFRIATRSAGSGAVHFFNGTIDEVRIYNRSLTASEIRELYNESKVSGKFSIKGSGDKGLRNESGLIMHLDIDTRNSTHLIDLSGHGHHGINFDYDHVITGTTVMANEGKFGQASYKPRKGTTCSGSPRGSHFRVSNSAGELNQTKSFFMWTKKNVDGNWQKAMGGLICGVEYHTYSFFTRCYGTGLFEYRWGAEDVTQWTHVGWVIESCTSDDLANDNITFYSNGIPTYKTNKNLSCNSAGSYLYFGGIQTYWYSCWGGYLDEIRAYNRIFTQSEVFELYNETRSSYKFSIKGNPSLELNDDANLVSNWKFDGNALDSKGSNDGTVIGATYNPKGKYKGAYEFDGKDDYIDCGPATNTNFNTNFSVSVWMNPGTVSEVGYLVSKATVGTTTGWSLYFQGGTNQIQLFRGSGPIASSSAVFTEANEWVYATMVYNDSSVSFYKNGIFLNTVDGSSFNVPTLNLYLGNRPGGSATATYFYGTIDEVMIFNRSLSASEVRSLYNESSVSNKFVIKGNPSMI